VESISIKRAVSSTTSLVLACADILIAEELLSADQTDQAETTRILVLVAWLDKPYRQITKAKLQYPRCFRPICVIRVEQLIGTSTFPVRTARAIDSM
jgi:hypothetical protein